jgi:ribosomal protein S18 acetylase RimI-like enzyme
MKHDIKLRPASPRDVDALSSICFDAFAGISGRHGFPPDFPSVDVARGLMQHMLGQADHVYSVVAEAGGRPVGSCFLWEGGAVAGVGPIAVDPAAQAASVGRRLMEAVLERARERRFPSVRLVQAAFNTRSMSLYTKLGFDVREPLVCLQGDPRGLRAPAPGLAVRKATEADVDACAEVCRRVHGHDRTGELRAAVAQAKATVVERGASITGYTTEVGFFGHAVGLTNYELMALIAGAAQIGGPGLLLPSRNGEVFRWCLAGGLKVVQPLTLMSLGLYNEPRGAFAPSILF